MNILDIKKIFEKRRYNLINALENNKDEIELSKQHQIYGAIKEIENMLKTLDYHREQEINNHFDFRLSNEEEKTILQRINLRFRGKNTESILKQD